MTRNLKAMETVAMAIADLYSTVEAFNFWSTECNDAWFRYEAHRYEEYDEDEDWEWERETAEWLRNHSPYPTDDNYSEIYSDIYKELYGFRPRDEYNRVIW